MKMYVEGVAEALAVPSVLVAGIGAAGLALLLSAGSTRSTALGAAAIAWGFGIVIIGGRAVVRPTRLVTPAISALSIIKTSRQAGGFWVLAGLVYIFIAAAIPLSR